MLTKKKKKLNEIHSLIEWTHVKGNIENSLFYIFMNDCTNKLLTKKKKLIFSLQKLNEKYFYLFFRNLKFREMEKKKFDYFMMKHIITCNQ